MQWIPLGGCQHAGPRIQEVVVAVTAVMVADDVVLVVLLLEVEMMWRLAEPLVPVATSVSSGPGVVP
jgi:hypothetical protein